MLTGQGGGPQGYLDGRQGQEVAGLYTGGGWAPKSLWVHGHHGSRGGDGNAGGAANRLQAVVTTACRRGTERSAWGRPGSSGVPREVPSTTQYILTQKTRAALTHFLETHAMCQYPRNTQAEFSICPDAIVQSTCTPL